MLDEVKGAAVVYCDYFTRYT